MAVDCISSKVTMVKDSVQGLPESMGEHIMHKKYHNATCSKL